MIEKNRDETQGYDHIVEDYVLLSINHINEHQRSSADSESSLGT